MDDRVTVGVDLVSIARVERLLTEQPDIRDTIFTRAEQGYCEARTRATQHYAARFAAKEAVLKAFGTGLGTGMAWTDVEVVRDRSGRPWAKLDGGVARHAAAEGLIDVQLSLSHTADLAIAQAVARFADRDR